MAYHRPAVVCRPKPPEFKVGISTTMLQPSGFVFLLRTVPLQLLRLLHPPVASPHNHTPCMGPIRLKGCRRGHIVLYLSLLRIFGGSCLTLLPSATPAFGHLATLRRLSLTSHHKTFIETFFYWLQVTADPLETYDSLCDAKTRQARREPPDSE